MRALGHGPARNHGDRALPLWAGRLIAVSLVLTASTAIAAAAATATNGASAGASEVLFIAEIGLLLLVGRLMGEAAQRFGQPPVMGQLIAGVMLGPSLFGLIWPSAQHALFPADAAQQSMLDAVSQLGILMLLLLTGMETDLPLVRRVGRAAVTVAIAGVTLPFVCGFVLGEFLPAALLPNPEARLVTAIFLGTALSISSIKIVAMVVREMNFMRRDLGQIIVASAILEDTIGWVIIAVALGLASAGSIDLWTVGRAVIGTALFMVASLTVGRRIVFNLIRWANDNFASEFPVITMILLIMIGMALITQLIGVSTVLGRFRRRHPDRQIADPDPPHRRTAARAYRRFVHAGVFRAVRIARRSHRAAPWRSGAAHGRPSFSSPASENSSAPFSAASSAGSAAPNRWRSAAA